MSMLNLDCVRSSGLAILTSLLAMAAAHGSTIVVNSTADPAGFNSGITVATLGATVTLRDALNAANNTAGADTITFAPSLAGQTVWLTNVQSTLQGPAAMVISSPISIQGLTGSNGVVISAAGGNTCHFQINPGGTGKRRRRSDSWRRRNAHR